ncbi:mechanosensitive ion channel family protein [Haloimpatiens sp. FM7330]|uniref:mechanosensitive ion channel family protein n=1 Tax=Haloimpatiens sp. FM7330 TaxID=3298610 RepID=UPI0036448BC2
MSEVFSNSVFAQKVNGIVDYFSYDNLKIVAIAILIFLFFILLRKFFTKYIFKLILKILSRTKTKLNTKMFLAFQKPLNLFFIVLGLYTSIVYLRIKILGSKYIASVFLQNFFSSAVIILIAWGCYNLTNTSSVLFEKMQKKFDINMDKILFPFIAKVIRFIIVAFAAIIVIEKWGYDIQGFIAGLGLGGLAFALAAKDTAANIVGGIIILLDKPFNIGDWIKTTSVEGTIEDISFRSTKIRNFEKGLVTVPNSTLANEPITNWSRRGNRRINFNIGVTYDTPSYKIKKCVEEMKEMLKKHEDVSKETILVNFNKFNDSSLDILLYFFVNTSELAKYLEIKENINFKIMEIFEKEQVSMAFPSTSIYVETPINVKGNINEKNKFIDKNS